MMSATNLFYSAPRVSFFSVFRSDSLSFVCPIGDGVVFLLRWCCLCLSYTSTEDTPLFYIAE